MHTPISFRIDLNNMITFRKSKYKNNKKQHKINNIIDNLNHHHDKETELSEYSYEIEHFYQRKHHTEYEQNSADVGCYFVYDV